MCANDASDMTMAVCSPDSCDSTCAVVRPLGLPPLDGASVAHPEDIYVLLKRTVSVWTHMIPGRPSPLIAVGRPDGTLPTSALGVDSPEFLDKGDPVLCLPVPRLRRCLRVMDLASDIDPGPDISQGAFGWSLGGPPGALTLAVGHCWLRLVVLTSYARECLSGY